MAELGVRIGLSAVVMALHNDRACVLTTTADDGALALPFGPFDPVNDRTFELALRAFVSAQTGLRLGFVEQLYTFGDLGRDSPRATQDPGGRREVSVGYLALTADATSPLAAEAAWTPVLEIFPWEDRRADAGAMADTLRPRLSAWAGENPARHARIDALFGAAPTQRWPEGRVLERYELLYEAGLVGEAARDHDQPARTHMPGLAMTSDHRRILATGLGRLRSKLLYRPVLFDLMPGTFTLSELQAAAEAVSGLPLHKQNFRRGVERMGLVEPTGRVSSATGGRPAELFRRAEAQTVSVEALGLPLPAQR